MMRSELKHKHAPTRSLTKRNVLWGNYTSPLYVIILDLHGLHGFLND